MNVLRKDIIVHRKQHVSTKWGRIAANAMNYSWVMDFHVNVCRDLFV